MPTKEGYKKYRAKILASIKAWKKRNPEKVKLYNKHWEERNKELLPRIHKNHNLKYQFGITIEDYDNIVKKQNGKCKICGKLPGQRALAVDHNHQTNQIRGLLCIRCNLTLGWFEKHKKEIKGYLK